MATLLRDGFNLKGIFTEEELNTIPPKNLIIKGQNEDDIDKGLNPNERHLKWNNACKDVEAILAEVNKLLIVASATE